MQYAGMGKRLLAYTIDMIPIFLTVFGIAYFFLEFDQTLSNFFNDDKTLESRTYFLTRRNAVRDTALLVWIIYGLLMDCSRFQGTLGKRALGIKVVDRDGERISLTQSIKRSSMKIAGAVPLYLGYIWGAFRKDKATWHDLIAKTYVIKG